MTGPLAGIRILDLSTVILGPYATQILSDLGAEVVKVEAPGGDITRNFGPCRNPGMTPLHLALNRNKRSIELDLKDPKGRDALLKLAATADVFLHNMKEKAAASLGIGYDDIRAVRPDIVYAWASGYGSGGAYAGRPAYDDVIQAAGGLAGLQGAVNGEPAYVATIPADKSAALTLVYSVMAALFHRQRTGVGQEVQVPMFETMVSWTILEHQWGLVFDPPVGGSGYPRVLSPARRPFRTKDGWIGVSPYTDAHWRAFLAMAGHPELAHDPRFATVGERLKHITVLYDFLGEALARETTAYWLEKLVAGDVPSAPVHTVESLLEDEHLLSVGFFVHEEHPTEGRIVTMRPPVRFSESPAAIRSPAPRLGEHTLSLLREAGLSEVEIEAVAAGRRSPAAVVGG